jgi:Protein of unknown function (DUF2950)
MCEYESKARTSKAAKASLILGILSFLCLGPLTAVPGLILGLVGLGKTGRGGLGGRGMAVGGTLICLANILIIAVMMVVAGSRIMAELEQQGISFSFSSEAAVNEAAAIAALKELHAAQLKYKAARGNYANDLLQLVTVDPSVAQSAISNSSLTPSRGYYFVSLIQQGSGFVDHTRGFVIIAMPAEYGKSGKRSFAIGPTGKVLANDTGGQSVTDAATLAGWQPCR